MTDTATDPKMTEEVMQEATTEETVQEEPLSRQEIALQTIENYSLGGVVVGIIPVPLVDLAGIAAVQLKMLHSLAELYEVPFSKELATSSIYSLLGSTVSVSMAPTIAASLTKFIPVVGSMLAAASLPILAGASTIALGKVFIQHFESGGTFLTFDPEKVREHYEQEYQVRKKQQELEKQEKETV